MGLDESEVSRLLRGDVPNDDPVWGEVSSFLDTVGTAYPAVPTTAFESRHLAAVARESRLAHSELQPLRQGAVKRLFQGSHRVLAGSVGAFLIVLTAGVGVASALGINPLGQLIAPHPVASSVVPQATSPKPSNSDPADGKKNGEPGTESPQTVPGSVPTPTGQPTPSPTATSSKSDDDTAKASAKAEKEAEKAKKDAEKAAEKAKREAEKAAKEAEKNKAKATPTPTPTPTSGKGKGKGKGND
jgi:outer membrane biosynthesis protein TonB